MAKDNRAYPTIYYTTTDGNPISETNIAIAKEIISHEYKDG